MSSLTATIVGVINIIVYQTSEGNQFFRLQGNDENLSPILDVIEDLLVMY